MTAKRFTHQKWIDERQLFDGNRPFAIVDTYKQADIICKKLNYLHEIKKINEKCYKELLQRYDSLKDEKDNLLIDCNNLIDDNTELTVEINEEYQENQRLKKENRQLRDLIMHLGYTIKKDNGVITLELKQ